MKRTFLIPILFLFLAMFPALFLFPAPSLYAQSPHGIPYQAVMRNADGSVMASSAVNLTFMIHNGTANGTIVYQESHALTSNTQGLVACVVGNGTASQGTFVSINWGSGAKFLHVMMGTTDLGTQQMLSVPYALYADNTNVTISASGDTLTIGGQSVIVPGISAANPINNGGLGSQVLVGNTTCANQYISVTGCGGQTSLTYDGRTYDLVEIGGQCWFADNLATDQYRNGDLIPTGLDNTTWQNTTAGAYAIYNNDPANDATYGKLYNWYTTVDSRGLCPTGWHVPTECEWEFLLASLGGIQVAGGKMKSTNIWLSPNTGANNLSGFSGLPGAVRNVNGYNGLLLNGTWWSKSESDSLNSWFYNLAFNFTSAFKNVDQKKSGFSVRCIRD